MKLTAKSFSCCSGMVLLLRPIWTLGAEYSMTRGGVDPAGKERRIVWQTAATWASAVWMLADGRKNILTTATPFRDCDSMCSISFTVVGRTRSVFVVIR